MCYSVMIKAKEAGDDSFKKFYDGIVDDVFLDDWTQIYKFNQNDPKFFKLPDENGRIFPNVFAPIVIRDKTGTSQIVPMRYQIWPRTFEKDPQYLSLFNARYDNLTKPQGLWHHLFGKQHGLIVIEKFYEWVQVSDLIKAGVVSLSEIKDEFHKQEIKRKKESLAKGKPYKPTKTMLLDPMNRKIEIAFTPQRKKKIIVPVIYDEHKLPNGYVLKSFAILTDEPTPEVAAAGHDRSPIFLSNDATQVWLEPWKFGANDLLDLLHKREDVHYSHELIRAA